MSRGQGKRIKITQIAVRVQGTGLRGPGFREKNSDLSLFLEAKGKMNLRQQEEFLS